MPMIVPIAAGRIQASTVMGPVMLMGDASSVLEYWEVPLKAIEVVGPSTGSQDGSLIRVAFWAPLPVAASNAVVPEPSFK